MPRIVQRDFGTSLMFNGTTNFVSIPGQASDFNGSFSVAAWFKPSRVSGGGTTEMAIVSKANSTNTNFKYHLVLGANNRMSFQLFDGVNNPVALSSDYNLTNQWQQAVAVVEGAQMRLYRNGVLVSTAANTATLVPSTNALNIGRRPGVIDRFFNGNIDAVTLYNRALTDAEIQDLYYRGMQPTTNLVGRYRFNEGSGTTVIDEGSGGNNGTINGAVYSTDVAMKNRQQLPQTSSFNKGSFANLRPSTDGRLTNPIVYGLSTQAGTPTPDAPVAIVSTTGNQTVNSRSKNILNSTTITGGINLNAFAPSKTLGGFGTFTFSGTTDVALTGNSVYLRIDGVDAPTNLMGVVTAAAGARFTFTHTLIPANVAALLNGTNAQVFIFKSGAGFTTFTNVQIEAGNILTSYEAPSSATQTLPLGTTQLRSLPNGVSDRIYKSGSSWFLEQNVGYRILNGVENYFTDGALATVSRYGTGFSGANAVPSSVTLTSHFPHVNNYNADVEHSYTPADGLAFYLFVNTSRASTVAALRAYLAANPVTAQYQLLTPVTTTLDPTANATLITALENIRTYQGVTNITASTPISGSYGTANRAIPEKQRQPVGELVYNGDFEYAPAGTTPTSTAGRWVDGAGGSLTNYVYGWGTGTSIYSGASVSFENGRIKILSQTGSSNNECVVQQYITARTATAIRNLIPCEPSTSYTLTGIIETENVSNANGGGARIRVLEDTPTGYNSADNSHALITGTTPKTKYTVTFTTKSNTRFLEVGCVLRNETGTAWFDNISLQRTDGTSVRQIIT